MIKNIVGAVVGSSLAKSSPVTGGAAGAAIATAVPFVLSRMSIPAMIVLGVGGYYAKRYYDRRKAESEAANDAPTAQSSIASQSEPAQVDTPPEGAVTNGTGTSPHTPAIAAI